MLSKLCSAIALHTRALRPRRAICLVLPHDEIPLHPDPSEVWLAGDRKVCDEIRICKRCLNVRRLPRGENPWSGKKSFGHAG